MSRDLREQIALADPRSGHWLLFTETGAACPPLNHLTVMETFGKFVSDFLPQCPITDPRGKTIRIRKDNFPKFLNLIVKPGFPPKKPSTIVEQIERGQFDALQYDWAPDRIKSLFWVPDVISDPDAIYVKKTTYGRIRASEVYVKVYCKMGATVKLVFVDYFGKSRDPIFITSFWTDPQSAMKHCAGSPLHRRI
jgi:hypothetical protein